MHDHDVDSVAVIIVNHNSGDCLARCLSCLAAQQQLPTRIAVIDNASEDGSVAAARHLSEQDDRLASRIEFHGAGENLGFAAANNRAITTCDTAFVALLNADAFPDDRWLEKLLDAARRHPRAAAFGSRQMLDGLSDTLDGIGDVCHVSGLSWREGHGRRLRAEDLEEREIFSPCAAAALYRREALEEVGGFDEDFFCYFEDVDLGFRLQLAGYAARTVARAGVSHVSAASTSGRRSSFAVYHGRRNLIWCFVKNMPFPLVVVLLPGQIALVFYNLFTFARLGRGKEICLLYTSPSPRD